MQYEAHDNMLFFFPGKDDADRLIIKDALSRARPYAKKGKTTYLDFSANKTTYTVTFGSEVILDYIEQQLNNNSVVSFFVDKKDKNEGHTS